MTAYRIAPAPKYAGMKTWDCARCDHEDLRRPVFVTDGGATIAVGTGCAARLLDVTVRDAEREAALAAIDGRDDQDGQVIRQAVGWLRMFRPQRVTDKLVREIAARYWVDEDLAREAATLYRAAYGK